MCGRYAFALSNEEVYDALQNQLPRMFQGGRPRWEREEDYRPNNYNVAPRQRMPVIHRDQQDSTRAEIHTMQWGLIPHWTKHPPTAPLNTINARSEALIDSSAGGMWQALKGYKRCVIPAQGYYEWLKRPSSKVAHFARQPFPTEGDTPTPYPLLFFAGLHDTVKYTTPVESHFTPSGPDDKRVPYPTGNPVPLSTFTILTTSPPKEFSWLHDRMPCILQTWEEVAEWLDLGQEPRGWVDGKGGTGEVLRGRAGLECYPVPPEVGKVGTNSPTYIQPVSQRADGIKSFFQKQTHGASPAKSKGKTESTPTKTPKQETSSAKAAKQESASASPSRPTKRQRMETPEVELLEDAKESKPLDSDAAPKTEIEEGDVEVGLGDDSNAPLPRSTRSKVPKSEAEPKDAGDGAEADAVPTPSKKTPRRGGHEIHVTRKKEAEEGDKEQTSITAFFGSPALNRGAQAQSTGSGSRVGAAGKRRRGAGN